MTAPKESSQGNNNIKLLKRTCSKFVMIKQQARKHLMNVVMMNLSISILSILLLTPRICLSSTKITVMIVTLLKLIKKTVEAVLANSVLVSTPNKEANLHLVEAIDSTIDQFKALIKKARKFTVDNDFKVKDRHIQSKIIRRQR